MAKDSRNVVRTKDAGVFFGKIVSKENTATGIVVRIENARRVYYWEGAATLSELAQKGVTKPESCKFPCPVDMIETVAIEILDMTEEAGKSLDSVPVWTAKK